MLDYLVTNKDWIFDGWGVAAIGLLITAVTAGGAWLYKKFRSSPNPPQLITVAHPIPVQLIPPKKEKQPSTELNTEVASIVKRFNTVLSLMNQRRTYNQYTIAKLAQIMQLSSVSELEDIFLGKCEPGFGFIDRFCDSFGVYKEWLINGEITPYYNNDKLYLMPLDYFDEIMSSKPDRIFFIRCNSPIGETFIVLKFSDWKYKIIGFMWHISDHVGGAGQVQIFNMYCLIKALEKEGLIAKCTGRLLNEESFRELYNGTVFPWGILESPNSYANYWWDDFIDVYHKSWLGRSQFWISDHYEALYGKGFLFAQEVVRYDLEDHEKRKAAQPRIHVPQHCIVCRALSNKEDDRTF